MRRLLVVLLLAVSGAVLVQPPGHAACRCVTAGQQAPSTDTHIRNADVILVGTVTDKGRGSGSITYEVDVERVYKGTANVTQVLRSPARADDCSLDNLRVDRRYVVFGALQGEVVEVNRCGGTAPASASLVDKVVSRLGEGELPEGAEQPTPPDATFERVDGAEPTAFSRLAAPGAALVILGLVGLLLVRRKR